MTVYELASLHAQILQTANAQLANWLAVLTVYLGAGYIVAHRLSLPSAIALSLVAVSALVVFALSISRTVQTFIGVSQEIQKIAARRDGLEWHQAIGLSPGAMSWMETSVLLILLTLVAVAVYFFFSSRRHNLKSAP